MYKYILVLLISFGVCAADNQQNGDLNTNTQDSTVNNMIILYLIRLAVLILTINIALEFKDL